MTDNLKQGLTLRFFPTCPTGQVLLKSTCKYFSNQPLNSYLPCLRGSFSGCVMHTFAHDVFLTKIHFLLTVYNTTQHFFLKNIVFIISFEQYQMFNRESVQICDLMYHI